MSETNLVICQLCEHHSNRPSYCDLHSNPVGRKNTCPQHSLSKKKLENYNIVLKATNKIKQVEQEKLDDTNK